MPNNYPKFKHITRRLQVFALLAATLISSQGAQANPPNPTKPLTLLILGDSLSAAYGMAPSEGWVNLLQTQLLASHVKIVNASISGETSSGGKQRIQKLIAEHAPKWLILELGANDALRGQNLKYTEKNLQFILNQCQPPTCQALLLGIKLPTNYGPAYEQALEKMYQRLATQNAVLFDPFFLADLALDPNRVQTDGLHPNAQAQPFIKDRIWQHIRVWFNTKQTQ